MISHLQETSWFHGVNFYTDTSPAEWPHVLESSSPQSHKPKCKFLIPPTALGIDSLFCLSEPFPYVSLRWAPWSLKTPSYGLIWPIWTWSRNPKSIPATYLNKGICPQGPASTKSALCLSLPCGPWGEAR